MLACRLVGLLDTVEYLELVCSVMTVCLGAGGNSLQHTSSPTEQENVSQRRREMVRRIRRRARWKKAYIFNEVRPKNNKTEVWRVITACQHSIHRNRFRVFSFFSSSVCSTWSTRYHHHQHQIELSLGCAIPPTPTTTVRALAVSSRIDTSNCH